MAGWRGGTGAGWQVGEGDTIEGAGWQGGTELEVADCDFKLRGTRDANVVREGTWGHGTRATHARGHVGKVTRGDTKDPGARRSRGHTDKNRCKNSGWFRTVGNLNR